MLKEIESKKSLEKYTLSLEKKNKDYLFLYKMVNNGSLKGATTFEDFYWHYTYYSRYSSHLVGEGRGH
jgi:hypothetical protein